MLVKLDPTVSLARQTNEALLAALVYLEARGEPVRGQVAVAWTPIERVAREAVPPTLSDVILKPYQYSCFNRRPDVDKIVGDAADDEQSWGAAAAVATLVLGSLVLNPAPGATHYCRVELWNRTPVDPARPEWFEAPEIRPGRTRFIVEIGKHVFAEAP